MPTGLHPATERRDGESELIQGEKHRKYTQSLNAQNEYKEA